MHINRVSFTWPGLPKQGVELSIDLVYAVLQAWHMNGQICGSGEWPIITENKGYSTVTLSPERDSLDDGFGSVYVKKSLARAQADGLRLTWQGLGKDVDSLPICSCASPSAYMLFTNYLLLESPIRCLDCFHPVALYRMKAMESGEFNEIISWQSNYQSCDRLQMNCTVLERAATREMSNIDSSLTKDGRAHCATLCASSGRPFYYYLYRGHGRSYRSELARRCPGCGGEWHLDAALHRLFDFKCDHCHLLSNVGFNVRP